MRDRGKKVSSLGAFDTSHWSCLRKVRAAIWPAVSGPRPIPSDRNHRGHRVDTLFGMRIQFGPNPKQSHLVYRRKLHVAVVRY